MINIFPQHRIYLMPREKYKLHVSRIIRILDSNNICIHLTVIAFNTPFKGQKL